MATNVTYVRAETKLTKKNYRLESDKTFAEI